MSLKNCPIIYIETFDERGMIYYFIKGGFIDVINVKNCVIT